MIYSIFVLVIITQVSTDWVEITQQLPRTPVGHNNEDNTKYTTETHGIKNSDKSSQVNLDGIRDSLYKRINPVESVGGIRRPAKGNRIYIKHDNIDKSTPSYLRDAFVKDNLKLNQKTEATSVAAIANKNTRDYVSHKEATQNKANKKENSVNTVHKNNSKILESKESLEINNDRKVSKNSVKNLHAQKNIQLPDGSVKQKRIDTFDSEVKSTTERIRVITSKKGNRIYFLYNDNRPSLVKNKIVKTKNNSQIENISTQSITKQGQQEEDRDVIMKTTDKSIIQSTEQKPYEETQSTISNHYLSTSTTQVVTKIIPNERVTEYNEVKGKISGNKTQNNKIVPKIKETESAELTANKNNHEINSNPKNYLTTEAVKVLTSKKGNKIYFIYKDEDFDEPTLENYENITEITPTSIAIDGSLELETVTISGQDLSNENKKADKLHPKTNEEIKQIDKNETQTNNKINVTESPNITVLKSSLNERSNDTSVQYLDKEKNEIKNETARNKWIKGHVYRVSNLSHVSKLKNDDPELLNITHINHDKKETNGDNIVKKQDEKNIFIKEHPTAIVDKTKLETYDDLPIRKKVDLIDDEEKTPEFVTIQDQDFEDRFEEIYIVDGDDEISKLLEQEMKRTEDGSSKSDSEEDIIPYSESIKTDYATPENEDNYREINHKRNPIENIIKFMKVVADNIAKNTHTSNESKVRYLKELKESIMRSIEERIDAAWPDDVPRSRREARGSHIEFPSSESALMSISFLTFAVYLIKLVLYVIQAYKNKTTMFPAVVAVNRAADIVSKLINNN